MRIDARQYKIRCESFKMKPDRFEILRHRIKNQGEGFTSKQGPLTKLLHYNGPVKLSSEFNQFN